MQNKSISLPIRKVRTQDSEGFVHEHYEYMWHIPANFSDTSRNDETLAAQKGYTADVNIEIMACNYNGAAFLIDEEDGHIYDIKRTFKKDKSMKIVLTCERRECGDI